MRGKIAARVGPVVSANPEKSVFYGHLITLFAAVIYVVPFEFMGLGWLKKPAYMLSLWSSVLTSIFAIGSNSGAPTMPQNLSLSNWKQGMAEAQQSMAPWLQQVMQGTDFPFLFFTLIFLAAYPSVIVLGILGRRSAMFCGTYCEKSLPDNRLFKMFSSHWAKLKANKEEVVLYAALAEILLGFWLVVSIALPTRQILVALLYWNYLKTRFGVPRSRKYHEPAWRMIGAKVEPLFRALPMLRPLVDKAKAWFQPQYTYQAR